MFYIGYIPAELDGNSKCNSGVCVCVCEVNEEWCVGLGPQKRVSGFSLKGDSRYQSSTEQHCTSLATSTSNTVTNI